MVFPFYFCLCLSDGNSPLKPSSSPVIYTNRLTQQQCQSFLFGKTQRHLSSREGEKLLTMAAPVEAKQPPSMKHSSPSNGEADALYSYLCTYGFHEALMYPLFTLSGGENAIKQ